MIFQESSKWARNQTIFNKSTLPDSTRILQEAKTLLFEKLTLLLFISINIIFKPYKKVEYKCIIKGDQKYQNIAAASILAKTYRDDIMQELDVKYPKYSWKNNKGYPTREHRIAIKTHGLSQYHRRSFRLL